MTRKRASGPVRARVLAALRAAVDERGPGCFPSLRAAARALAADLDISLSTVRRALADPQSDLEATVISAAIRPAASATADGTHRVMVAGFAGEPLVSHQVSQVNHPGSPGSPPLASPQASHGEPPVSHPAASRAHEPRPSNPSAPLCPPQVGPPPPGPAEPYVPDGPPLPTTLDQYPHRIRRSQFPGECLLCAAGLDGGQAFYLAPYGAAPARMFCMDCAEQGLEIAQFEWLLAGKTVPKKRKPKPDPNPTTPPEE